MIREAELFVQADRALVGLVSRIRDDQWHLVLPPVFDMPGADVPVEVRSAVNHLAYDDAWVPAMLAGSTMDETGRDTFDGDLPGDDPPRPGRPLSPTPPARPHAPPSTRPPRCTAATATAPPTTTSGS